MGISDSLGRLWVILTNATAGEWINSIVVAIIMLAAGRMAVKVLAAIAVRFSQPTAKELKRWKDGK